ncbi:hypothetical protein SAMN05444682_115102 [Parapedobacter indicus]|uniref:Uncharacterized protein n=1 Tax=Parapedobacter indicus TaxID=1477437 RepID=A0A1I3UYJ4_9SPHI|nr:hypothetical protein CLV26_11576 [Parapedobacter indicus]SFJ87749.1 hypothetical protein SAMN05444682_115102 [Parapedobacter indicus]
MGAAKKPNIEEIKTLAIRLVGERGFESLRLHQTKRSPAPAGFCYFKGSLPEESQKQQSQKTNKW